MPNASWNTDRIIGLSAMMISLLTLIIFIYQTNIMRKQSRLSVTPRMSFNQEEVLNDSIFYVRYNMKNKGLGPAIIQSVTIVYKGKRIKDRFSTFFEDYFPGYQQYANLESNSYLSNESTLSPNEEVNFFTLSVPVANLNKFLEYIDFDGEESPFDIEIVYSSIYQDKWILTLLGGGPQPLKG